MGRPGNGLLVLLYTSYLGEPLSVQCGCVLLYAAGAASEVGSGGCSVGIEWDSFEDRVLLVGDAVAIVPTYCRMAGHTLHHFEKDGRGKEFLCVYGEINWHEGIEIGSSSLLLWMGSWSSPNVEMVSVSDTHRLALILRALCVFWTFLSVVLRILTSLRYWLAAHVEDEYERQTLQLSCMYQ